MCAWEGEREGKRQVSKLTGNFWDVYTTAANLDEAKVGIWLSPRNIDRSGRLTVGGLLTLGWALKRDMSNWKGPLMTAGGGACEGVTRSTGKGGGDDS